MYFSCSWNSSSLSRLVIRRCSWCSVFALGGVCISVLLCVLFPLEAPTLYREVRRRANQLLCRSKPVWGTHGRSLYRHVGRPLSVPFYISHAFSFVVVWGLTLLYIISSISWIAKTCTCNHIFTRWGGDDQKIFLWMGTHSICPILNVKSDLQGLLQAQPCKALLSSQTGRVLTQLNVF